MWLWWLCLVGRFFFAGPDRADIGETIWHCDHTHLLGAMPELSLTTAAMLSPAKRHEHGPYPMDSAPPAPTTAMAIAPDKDLLLCGSQQGIEITSLAQKTTPAGLTTHLSQVHDLVFPADGSLLVAGGSPARQGTIEVWNWNERKLANRWNLHKDLIYRVACSPDGKRLATASHDGTCKVVDAKSGQVVAEFTGHSRPVLAIAFLPDSDLVVSAGVDQTVQVWHGTTGKPVRAMENHTAAVNDLAVRPSQKDQLPLIATASEDRTVRFWQPTIGRLVRFAKFTAVPRTLCWNQEGTELWVGCDDGQVHIVDPDTLKTLQTKTALKGRIFALLPQPNGKGILCAGETGRVDLPK